MQNYYYLKSMVAESLSLDIVEPLVEVGRGYFDAIIRKIIYVNIFDETIYTNLSTTISKTISNQLKVSENQFLMIFGQRFCMNNFYNINFIQTQLQSILKIQNQKFRQEKRKQQKKILTIRQQNDSQSFFSIEISNAQLSAYQLSYESNQFQNKQKSQQFTDFDLQSSQQQTQNLEQVQKSYANWDQSRFMKNKKLEGLKNCQKKAIKLNSAAKTEQDIRNAIRKKEDVQVPSFLRFNLIKTPKNPYSFDPKFQIQNQILTYVESVLIPKTQLSLFCQHMKLAYPLYQRTVKDKIFYIKASIIMSNLFTKFVQKKYQGKGMAPNLKMSENQASIDLLTKLWLQFPQIWKQFINRKKQKKLSYY